jgi:DNA polymerase III delta prime subunit
MPDRPSDSASESAFDPVALAAALEALQQFAYEHAPPKPSQLADRLVAHLQHDPLSLPVVSNSYAVVERPNLQLGLDAWAAEPGHSVEIVGLNSPNRGHEALELSQLVAPGRWHPGVELGPPTYLQVPVAPDATLACLTAVVLLISNGDHRIVALVADSPDMGMRAPRIHVQAISASGGVAAAFLAELDALAIERNVYRGQVISFSSSGERGPMTSEVQVRFHERAAIDRADVVLADGVLERIERHVIGVANHADALRAAGRDLKRGLLLFGPPGTGKTLTVQYLAAQQPTRTVMLVAGADVGGLVTACRLARTLAPATVVLEDVDLVAEERTMFGHGQNTMIAALLNEMDAVSNDADVVFMLTTNRADLLEPALANRPGRVDQAIEVALPDAACRARLVDLYGATLGLTDNDRVGLVGRLDGVTAAFIKELMRRATVLATLAGHTAGAADVDAALDELFDDASSLTRTLLGAAPTPTDRDANFANVHAPPHFTIPVEVRRLLDQSN